MEEIQQLEQDRGCQETAGMPNDQNPRYDSAAGSGRVVGAPSHGPKSAHKSDDDLLSPAVSERKFMSAGSRPADDTADRKL